MLDRTQSPATQTEFRHQLATAFRLAERFGFHEGICNHFSVQLPGEQEFYLINPYGVHWSEMKPESLLLIDGQGEILAGDGEVETAAKHIHISGHRANPQHVALFHTHMPYATALTMTQGGRLEMAHQTATRFYNRTGYVDTFGGLVHSAEEGRRLATSAKGTSKPDIVFLANHGVVVGGTSVAVAFEDLYYLERACRQQVLAQSTGLPLKLIPEKMVRETAAQWMANVDHFAALHFDALSRVLETNADKGQSMTF